MINSLCIKNNQNFILDYLLNQLQQTDLDGIYLSKNNFKNYKNIIIHNTGKCSFEDFIHHVSGSIANTILALYEQPIIKKIIFSNYFYFSTLEKQKILDTTKAILNTSPKDILFRRKIISMALKNYLKENQILILDGFINFRLKEYLTKLDESVDISVDKFIIEKEYDEFISLLKLYINSKESETKLLHLIYKNQNSIILDENKQKINISDHIFDAQYLSDISFSSNDFALNTILNIVPQKLCIHLVKSLEDEFINTLKLIFEERICFCNGCSICDVYNDSSLIVSAHKNCPFIGKQ